MLKKIMLFSSRRIPRMRQKNQGNRRISMCLISISKSHLRTRLCWYQKERHFKPAKINNNITTPFKFKKRSRPTTIKSASSNHFSKTKNPISTKSKTNPTTWSPQLPSSCPKQSNHLLWSTSSPTMTRPRKSKKEIATYRRKTKSSFKYKILPEK